MLDEAARNVLSEKEITAFIEKIRDSKAKAAVAQIFADVFRSVSGREFGVGSLRGFADSWLTGVKSQLSSRSYPKYKAAVQAFLTFLGKVADRIWSARRCSRYSVPRSFGRAIGAGIC